MSPTRAHGFGLPSQFRHTPKDNRRNRDGTDGEKGYGKSERTDSGSRGICGIRAGFCTERRVKNTPSSSTCNRFEILSNIIDSEADILDVQTLKQAPTPSPAPKPVLATPKPRRQNWEKAMPESYCISAVGESNSLKLKVELETTDTSERKSVNSLVDSGANREFINREYAKSCQFNLLKLTTPIPVYNIDGTLNEAGSITEAVSLILRYKGHSEWTIFCVTSLGKQKLILGHSWLRKHNLEIDWEKGEVKMSRCPPRCCSGCRDELCQEQIT